MGIDYQDFSYFSENGIALRCEFGEKKGTQRAIQYAQAYELMTPLQISQSNQRELELIGEELIQELHNILEFENWSKKCRKKLEVKTAA